MLERRQWDILKKLHFPLFYLHGLREEGCGRLETGEIIFNFFHQIKKCYKSITLKRKFWCHFLCFWQEFSCFHFSIIILQMLSLTTTSLVKCGEFSSYHITLKTDQLCIFALRCHFSIITKSEIYGRYQRRKIVNSNSFLILQSLMHYNFDINM